MARLRRLTIGSILGSVVALGGFATAAALSYSGKGATAGVPSTAATAPATSAPSTSTPTSNPATSTPHSTPTPTPVPTPAPVSSQPRASTGGS